MFGAQTSNGWCIDWPYCIAKSLSTVGWLALQTKANEFQKSQYCKKAGVKIGRLWYDFMPSGMIFSPVEFCKLLAATCFRFLVVCGCHWNWTGRKNHTTAGIVFWLTNTCSQIWAWGPDHADRQGDIFRCSFLSPLDLTTLPKGGGGLSGGGLVYLNSWFSPKIYVF